MNLRVPSLKFQTNNILTNYDVCEWGREDDGGWHFHRSYLRQNSAAWIEKGGPFDFLGGLEDLVKARTVFAVQKSREAIRYL